MAEALGAIEEIQRTIKAGHFKEALKMKLSECKALMIIKPHEYILKYFHIFDCYE